MKVFGVAGAWIERKDEVALECGIRKKFEKTNGELKLLYGRIIA